MPMPQMPQMPQMPMSPPQGPVMAPGPEQDPNAAPGFDDPLAGLGEEIPDEEYAARLGAVKGKIGKIRTMTKGYSEVGGRMASLSKASKIKALNRLFASLTSMGFDLNDPQSLGDLLSRLSQADPRWADLLSGLLDSLDPEKGAQPGQGLPGGLGEESPLNPLVARRIAEEMGVEMDPLEEEPDEAMSEDGDGSGEGTELEGPSEPQAEAQAPKPKSKK